MRGQLEKRKEGGSKSRTSREGRAIFDELGVGKVKHRQRSASGRDVSVRLREEIESR